jgi:fatty-acyl-CoA synthase
MTAARERVAGYEMPTRIIFVEEIPDAGDGKILKYELRERSTHVES